MRLLLTNDDGIHAEGLQALIRELRTLADVTVVAPDRERSAVGHSLTFHSPLRVRRLEQDEGFVSYTTDGTPTDCVLLALYDLMEGKLPDLVVSGINRGANLGDDVTYSGTVAAAMEGMIHGVPSLAISLVRSKTPMNYEMAARVAARLVRATQRHGMPGKTLLNVNVPNLPEEQLQGFKVTRQGHSIYDQRIVKRLDPWGAEYFWVSGETPTGEPVEGTDFEAVQHGYVSVTPLCTNLTHLDQLEALRAWQI
ncbi:MAG: 5'/3'-nucleotidase SurE [Candidatus Eremiobacterota bacterium]